MKLKNKKWFTLIELMIVRTMLSLIAIRISSFTWTVMKSFKITETNRTTMEWVNRIFEVIESTIYDSKEIVYSETMCEWDKDWNINKINDLIVGTTDRFVLANVQSNITLCWDDWKLVVLWLAETEPGSNDWYYYFAKYKNRELTRIWFTDRMSKRYRNTAWLVKTKKDLSILWLENWFNNWIADITFVYDWALNWNWITEELAYLTSLKQTAPKVKVFMIIERIFDWKVKFTKFDKLFIF